MENTDNNLVEGIHGHGGPTEYEHDARNFMLGSVTAPPAPFDWEKGIDLEAGKSLVRKDQNVTPSCGENMGGYVSELFSGIVASVKYAARVICSKENGTEVHDLARWMIQEGVCSELLCPSVDASGKMTMASIWDGSMATPEQAADAQKNRFNAYAFLPEITTETLACAQRDHGNVCILIRGENNGTWRSAFPKPIAKGIGIWGHYILGLKAKIIISLKKIGIINSWGPDVGENGIQWLGDENMKDIVVAFSLIKLEQNVAEMLKKHAFKDDPRSSIKNVILQLVLTLKKGAQDIGSDDRVKRLQVMIRDEATLASRTSALLGVTKFGYYGDTTFDEVIAWLEAEDRSDLVDALG